MRRVVSIAGALLLASSLIAASPVDPDPSATPDTVAELIAQSPDVDVADPAVRHASTVYVVGSKGEVLSTVGGNSQAVAAASGCSYRNAVFTSSAWQLSVDGCGILGWDSTASWRYDWVRDTYAWNNGPSCVQGRGYYTGTTLTRWYPAGCGNAGGATAHIGEILTVAKIRGYVNAVGTIGYVRWK